MMTVNELILLHPNLQSVIDLIPQYVLQHSSIRKYEPNDIILFKGQSTDYAYLHLNGILGVINTFESGKYYFVEMIDSSTLFRGFPDFIGSLAILAGSDYYTTTVSAKTNCLLLKIPTSYFLKWYNTDANVARSIAETNAKHLFDTTNRSENVLSHSGLYLLVQYLISFSAADTNKSSYTIPDKREKLAERFCVTIRTVNRNVKKLKESNYITVSSGKIKYNQNQLKELKNLLNSLS